MPIHLSASSIADFIRCPQKVMYRIKKTVQEEKSREMTIGTIAHLAIEKGWKDRERAYAVVASEVKRNGLKRADQTNLEFMMDIFFLNFKDKLGENDLIEHFFKLPLYDDVFIVGKIDRISAGNIFDWKSASKLPGKLNNDVQCIIYDWAFHKEFGREPNGIYVAGLSTGELIPFKKNDFYVSEVFTKIIPRMIRTIRHDEYERLGMFNHSCFRCPWKTGCLGGGYVMDNTISPE